jgi:plastocyanin
MTIRHALLAATAVALFLAPAIAVGAASTITGTVKVTGASSSADAVVYIQQASGPGAAPPADAEMNQQKMQFIPHVLAVVAGTKVKFLNSDPTPHNVFSPDNEKYNLGTWPQGQTKEHVFMACKTFPCVYTQLCRVHPEMEGFVVVLQNPYFATTARDGKYEIKDVPPGSYQVAVWHDKGKAQPKAVTVEAGKPAVVDFVLAK